MKQRSPRSYSNRTLKILWGRAAGRCAVPSCRVELFADATDYDPIVTIGDIAHIEASSAVGPRANRDIPASKRDEYENLILLCLTCHRRLDGQNNSNSVSSIKKLRADHEDWVRRSLPERGKSAIGWTLISLQGSYPFDQELAIRALMPDFSSGDPVLIRIDDQKDTWERIQPALESKVAALLERGDPFDFRLAIFPLAPVSACVALGYLLTDRPRVKLFKYYADEPSWSWPDSGYTEEQFTVSGIPDHPDPSTGDVALCFHISANITEEAVNDVNDTLCDTHGNANGNFNGMIHVRVPRPSTSWICHPSQLRDMARTSREVFETAQERFPNASKWHLFFAGPAPGAVIVGQQMNPTMCPPIQLYEYRRGRKPAYRRSMVLGEMS